MRRVTDGAGKLLIDASHASPRLDLPAKQTELRIEFAAPTFVPTLQGQVRTQYRTRLEGFEGDWSPWSTETRRIYTNLPYRSFTFRVQARALDGRVSGEEAGSRLAFAIAPPWWLTRWAYAGYGVIGLAAVAGVVSLRTRQLMRRSRQLETIVATRTRELAVRNAELARLHQLELDEKITARLAEEKTRLELLRYQLNPHFLFNAFNSLYGLVLPLSRPAGDLIGRLADFCRMTLTRVDDLQPLREEFAMLRAYLDIEQSRWRERLQIEFAPAEATLDEPLPPFLLLPLVENAIKYGTATSAERIAVHLSSHFDAEGMLIVTVANTGEWREPTGQRSATSTGIGLENLRQRLHRYYPDAHDFTIVARDGWVRATLRLRSKARWLDDPRRSAASDGARSVV